MPPTSDQSVSGGTTAGGYGMDSAAATTPADTTTALVKCQIIHSTARPLRHSVRHSGSTAIAVSRGSISTPPTALAADEEAGANGRGATEAGLSGDTVSST